MFQTKQEFYDDVIAHLIKQGKRSVVGAACAYRGSWNTSCAIGCKIPDSEYTIALEGWGPGKLTRGADGPTLYSPSLIMFGFLYGEDFLREMQRLHDRVAHWGESGPNMNFRYTAYQIAEQFKLIPYDFYQHR